MLSFMVMMTGLAARAAGVHRDVRLKSAAQERL
jgi:Ni,Fe-hydrogenase III large subunit